MNVNSIANGLANSALQSMVPGFELFESGRIRTTSHDGFLANSTAGGAGRTGGFTAEEVSAFATGSFMAPGTLLGANLRFTGLIGQTWLSTNLKPVPLGGQIAGGVGTSDITATLVGGSALMAWKSGWYAVGTTIGFFGSTETRDRINNLRVEYDNRGIVGSLTVGRVMPLDAIASGLKLDLRGSASYNSYEGDTFRVLGTLLKPTLSFWTASFQPMLFADIPHAGGTLRPYLQGTIKGLGDYENHLHLRLADGTFSDKVRFGQGNTYWGAEVGLNYGIGRWNFGIAGYTDQSRNEETWGGKIGASYRFGGN